MLVRVTLTKVAQYSPCVVLPPRSSGATFVNIAATTSAGLRKERPVFLLNGMVGKSIVMVS